MSLAKTYRVQDTKLMGEISMQPCVISGAPGPNDPSHVRGKGAFGDDVAWNICPLAHKFHQELHKIGAVTFAVKYPRYKQWLLDNNWSLDLVLNKWVHE